MIDCNPVALHTESPNVHLCIISGECGRKVLVTKISDTFTTAFSVSVIKNDKQYNLRKSLKVYIVFN